MAAHLSPPDARWAGARFTVKEKHLTLGRQYRILNAQGQMVAFCRQKMFKLREDIRFYADEAQQQELFRLHARRVIDFNANLDLVDSASGRVVGSLRRHGLRSMARDKWAVFDAQGQQVGVLEEDSWGMALLRRLLASFLPMAYTLTAPGGARLATVEERFQIIGDTYDLDLAPPAPGGPAGAGAAAVDPRLLVGLVVCVDALEGQ